MLDIRQIKGRLGGIEGAIIYLAGCFPGSEPGQDSYYSRRNAGKVQDMIGRTLVAFALVFSLAAPPSSPNSARRLALHAVQRV